MLTNSVYFGLGLIGLYLGAEWLVKGAAAIARRFGTSPLVIGLTVVAFGSSAPELLVGVVASVQRQSAVVLGNVVGSNILNIALILGVAALVRPLPVGMRMLSREAPLMLVITLVVVVMMIDGGLGRVDGSVLVAGFVAYLWFVLRQAEREPPAIATEYTTHEAAAGVGREGPLVRDLALVVIGLAALVAGAQLLLMSAVYFAERLGVSEIVIGLTVVAIGTSLPELATCVVAALRSQPDIALGNAVGSNVFNLLSILGVSSLIRPIPVGLQALAFEIPVMVVFAMVLVPLAWTGRVLGRLAGGLLVSSYVLFTVALVLRALA